MARRGMPASVKGYGYFVFIMKVPFARAGFFLRQATRIFLQKNKKTGFHFGGVSELYKCKGK